MLKNSIFRTTSPKYLENKTVNDGNQIYRRRQKLRIPIEITELLSHTNFALNTKTVRNGVRK